MDLWTFALAAISDVTMLVMLGWLARAIISQYLTRAIDAHKNQLAAASALDTERLKHQLQLAALEQQSMAANDLEKSKHDLGLLRSTYEHHLELILDYYSRFYRHYRRCQRAAGAEGFRQPNGSVIDTKEEFLDSLDTYLAESNEIEGKVRLILPGNLLKLHEELIGEFNRFRRVIQDFTSTETHPREKDAVFASIHELKTKLETGVREFLRTEHLLK